MRLAVRNRNTVTDHTGLVARVMALLMAAALLATGESAIAQWRVDPGEYHLLRTDGTDVQEVALFLGGGAIDVDHRFADLTDSLSWRVPVSGPGNLRIAFEIAGEYRIGYRLSGTSWQTGPEASDVLMGGIRRSWRAIEIETPAGTSELELRLTDIHPTDGSGPSVWHIEFSHSAERDFIFDTSNASWGTGIEPLPWRITTACIQGILNRNLGGKYLHEQTPAASSIEDTFWIEREKELAMDRHFVHADPLQTVKEIPDLFAGQILYDGTQIQIPVAVTAAGVLDAVPTTVDLGLNTILDLRGRFSSNLEALVYQRDEFLSRTDPAAIAVQRPDKPHLVDYIVSEQLLDAWFVQSVSEEVAIFEQMIDNAHFADMCDVVGYLEPVNPGETEVANQLGSRGQISLVSDFATNLSYHSRKAPSPVLFQTAPDIYPLDQGKRYYALIYSDGDNVQLVMNALTTIIETARNGNNLGDFPITFTFSNRLQTLAPAVVEYYQSIASSRARLDYIMGPSGYGFLHPILNPDHETFVTRTADAAGWMSTNAYVHWDEYNRLEALEARIGAYRETRIGGVFTPVLPHPAAVVNDVVVFPEIYRFFPEQNINSAAQAINYSGEQFGYIYLQIGTDFRQIQSLVDSLDSDIVLLTARELVQSRRAQLGLPLPGDGEGWAFY